MTKEEARSSVMGAISMALKDTTLQQGFEIICKNLLELEKENAELKKEIENDRDLPAIAYMQGAEKQKKKDDNQLTYAKTIIQDLLDNTDEYARQRAEQFLGELDETIRV